MTILIIEDEFIIARDVQLTLKKNGYPNSKIATNYLEVLEVFNSCSFDLIISDINLGKGKDGIEIIKELTVIKKTPVVFLTAYSDQDTVKRAETIFPFAYLLKPFNKNQLIITIKLALLNFERMKNTNFIINPKNTALIEKLTKREKEILVVYTSGKVIKEIADILNISTRTVEKHIENIKSKLNLHTSGELINFTMTSKLLTVSYC